MKTEKKFQDPISIDKDTYNELFLILCDVAETVAEVAKRLEACRRRMNPSVKKVKKACRA